MFKYFFFFYISLNCSLFKFNLNSNVTLLFRTYIVFPHYEHINIHEEKLEGTENYKAG